MMASAMVSGRHVLKGPRSRKRRFCMTPWPVAHAFCHSACSWYWYVSAKFQHKIQSIIFPWLVRSISIHFCGCHSVAVYHYGYILLSLLWILMDIILLMALDVATLSLYGMIRVGLRPALGICFWWMICQRPWKVCQSRGGAGGGASGTFPHRRLNARWPATALLPLIIHRFQSSLMPFPYFFYMNFVRNITDIVLRLKFNWNLLIWLSKTPCKNRRSLPSVHLIMSD